MGLTFQTACTIALTHTRLNSGHFATWHSRGKSNSTVLGNSPTSSHLRASMCMNQKCFKDLEIICKFAQQLPVTTTRGKSSMCSRRDGGSLKCQLEFLKRFGCDSRLQRREKITTFAALFHHHNRNSLPTKHYFCAVTTAEDDFKFSQVQMFTNAHMIGLLYWQ